MYQMKCTGLGVEKVHIPRQKSSVKQADQLYCCPELTVTSYQQLIDNMTTVLPIQKLGLFSSSCAHQAEEGYLYDKAMVKIKSQNQAVGHFQKTYDAVVYECEL